jgi:hypothetical protein
MWDFFTPADRGFCPSTFGGRYKKRRHGENGKEKMEMEN